MNKEKATEKVTVRKSNKSVKSAVMLFGAVLITTSLLGGVLAKYTTEIGTASDTGRVAHWGITEENITLDLFKTAYDKTPDGNSENTVVSNADTDGIDGNDKVIAPGTSGSLILSPVISIDDVLSTETAFTLTYTSVGKYVKSRSDNPAGDDWQVKITKDAPTTGMDWLPLRFRISTYQFDAQGDNGQYEVVFDGIDREDKIESDTPGDNVMADGTAQVNRLNEELNKLTKDFYPNDTVAVKRRKLAEMGVQIEWEWPFERYTAYDATGGPTPGSSLLTNVDFWDTQLGNKFVDNSGINPKFDLTMSFDAVQID